MNVFNLQKNAFFLSSLFLTDFDWNFKWLFVSSILHFKLFFTGIPVKKWFSLIFQLFFDEFSWVCEIQQKSTFFRWIVIKSRSLMKTQQKKTPKNRFSLLIYCVTTPISSIKISFRVCLKKIDDESRAVGDLLTMNINWLNIQIVFFKIKFNKKKFE